LLSNLSFDVRSVDCGATAVREVEHAMARGQPYDVIFLDWMMPGMDGLETARQLRRLVASTPAPPHLVIVTGYAREELFEAARAPGIDTLLMKPISASQLLETLMRLFAVAEMPQAQPMTAAVTLPDITRIAGARILLAEDNELNQEVALALLTSGGVSVDVAQNGVVAVEMVRSGCYDAVLMDMQMPLMDGLAAARAIRALPGRAELPIIAMTANVLSQDRERCLA